MRLSSVNEIRSKAATKIIVFMGKYENSSIVEFAYLCYCVPNLHTFHPPASGCSLSMFEVYGSNWPFAWLLRVDTWCTPEAVLSAQGGFLAPVCLVRCGDSHISSRYFWWWSSEASYQIKADNPWAFQKINLWLRSVLCYGQAYTPTSYLKEIFGITVWESCLITCMLRVFLDKAGTITSVCGWQVLLMSTRKLWLHTSSTEGSWSGSRILSIIVR